MYVTGGIGPSRRKKGTADDFEGFTEDYDLPNLTAYAETCAAIGMIFWNHRLFHLEPDRRYMDIIERELYNGAICGVCWMVRTFFMKIRSKAKAIRSRSPWPCRSNKLELIRLWRTILAVWPCSADRWCIAWNSAITRFRCTALPRNAKFTTHVEPDLLHGVTVLKTVGLAATEQNPTHRLYRQDPALTYQPCQITTIPYYAWDNRQPGAMRVWIRSV
ncbi:MAG: glycoside hydrolase family 127 protein [Candidatus Vecturithrix sp.]|jgi:DUF1680 family protein|nr:glycoside hydrolase family 127 protein [Candidatus Vecturithrix sp.]